MGTPGFPSPGQPTLLRPCSAPDWWCGTVRPLLIDYAFRLRLRGRL